jgi:hypothetical protein
MVTPKVVFAPE